MTMTTRSSMRTNRLDTKYTDEVDAVISYLRSLIGVPYKEWDGAKWRPDNTAPFWMPDYMTEPQSATIVPDITLIYASGGVNCAGLINLGLQRIGIEPPGIHTEYPGGTGAWGAYVTWMPYIPDRVYPRGSILLREYRNEKDQGHLAMIITDDNSIGMNNHLIHASRVLGCVLESPIHIVHKVENWVSSTDVSGSSTDPSHSSKTGNKTHKSTPHKLAISNITGGYFDYVCTPNLWLTHSWYGYCRLQRVHAGYRLP